VAALQRHAAKIRDAAQRTAAAGGETAGRKPQKPRITRRRTGGGCMAVKDAEQKEKQKKQQKQLQSKSIVL